MQIEIEIGTNSANSERILPPQRTRASIAHLLVRGPTKRWRHGPRDFRSRYRFGYSESPSGEKGRNVLKDLCRNIMWWFIKVTFTHVMMLHSTVRFKENLPLTIYSKSKETDTHLPDRTWLLSVEKQHIRRPMVGATPDLTCLKMEKK